MFIQRCMLVFGCLSLGGCNILSLSHQSDKELVQQALNSVEGVYTASDRAGLPTVKEVSEVGVKALLAVQEGPIGKPSKEDADPLAPTVLDAMTQEMSGTPVSRTPGEESSLRVELDRLRNENAHHVRESTEFHSTVRSLQDRAKDMAAKAASRYGAGWLFGVGGLGVLGVAGLAWRYRPALYAAVSALQEVKTANREGKTLNVADVILKHAGGMRGATSTLQSFYRSIKKRMGPGTP